MRIIVGVVAGFIAWLFVWLGVEMVLSAIWPAWFGAHQQAFQAAITNGAPFTPDTTIMVIHIVCGGVIAAVSGLIAAHLAGDHVRAPLVMGIVLLAMGLMKAMMSWSLVPIWYHALFTAALLVMPLVGGRTGIRRGGL